jgi:hypothetical protein
MKDSVPAEINRSKNANVNLAINSENITVSSATKKIFDTDSQACKNEKR